MSERKTYRAIAEREGAWWVIQVPEIRSVTQARRLDLAEGMVRDLVSAITDELPASFDVVVTPELARERSDLIGRAVTATARAREAQLEASVASREAAAALERDGLSVRDIGRLLGISHQRAQQLLAHKAEASVHRVHLTREIAASHDPPSEARKGHPVKA